MTFMQRISGLSFQGDRLKNGAIDDSQREFSQFYEAVKEDILRTYVATSEKIESILCREMDTLLDLFEDGSVQEASTMLAIRNDLEEK